MDSTANTQEGKEMNETKMRIKKLMAKLFGTEIDSISDSETLTSEVEGDSLDMVELMLAVEDEFSIEIPDEIVEELDTVEKVAEYLHRIGASDNPSRSTNKSDLLW
jgi:acyl carrier protein